MMRETWGANLGTILDEVFGVAESVKERVYSEMEKSLHLRTEGADYYPAYSFPPMNVYITPAKALVFEFALAGFSQSDITLRFQGDSMYFSAEWNRAEQGEDVTWLKKRLKSKSIPEQKYFVPQDKFDQGAAAATFSNGLLTLSIPARTEVAAHQEIHIPIKPS